MPAAASPKLTTTSQLRGGNHEVRSDRYTLPELPRGRWDRHIEVPLLWQGVAGGACGVWIIAALVLGAIVTQLLGLW